MPKEFSNLSAFLESSPTLTFPLVICAASAITYFAVRSMRARHPGKVYTLWYVFSLSLYINLVLGTYLTFHGGIVPPIPYDLSAQKSYFETFTSLPNELLLLAVVAGLCLLPQFLSYFAGGLFGCGSPPHFVSAVYRFFIWSLIKFFSFLAGLLSTLAILVFSFEYFPAPAARYMEAGVMLVEAHVALMVSFATAALYYKTESLGELLAKRLQWHWFAVLHRYFTRFTMENVHR